MKTLLRRTLPFLVTLGCWASARAGGGSDPATDPTSTSTRGGGEYRVVQGHIVLRDLIAGESCAWASGRELAQDSPEFQNSLAKLRAMHWFYADRLERAANELNLCMTNDTTGLANADGIFAGNLAARTGLVVRVNRRAFNDLDIVSQGLFLVHEAMQVYFSDFLSPTDRPLRLRSFVRALNDLRIPIAPATLVEFRQEIARDEFGWPTDAETLEALAPLVNDWQNIFDTSHLIDASIVESLQRVLKALPRAEQLHLWVTEAEGRRVAEVLEAGPLLVAELLKQGDLVSIRRLLQANVLSHFNKYPYKVTSRIHPREIDTNTLVNPIAEAAVAAGDLPLIELLQKQWPGAFDQDQILCAIPAGASLAVWEKTVSLIAHDASRLHDAMNRDCEQRQFIGRARKVEAYNQRVGRDLIYRVLDEHRHDVLELLLRQSSLNLFSAQDERCRTPSAYARDIGDPAAYARLRVAEQATREQYKSQMVLASHSCWAGRTFHFR